jgi:hypothetical protein
MYPHSAKIWEAGAEAKKIKQISKTDPKQGLNQGY